MPHADAAPHTSQAIQVVGALDESTLAAVQSLIKVAEEHDGAGAIGEHKFLRLGNGGAAATSALLAYADGALAGYGHAQAFPISATQRRLALEMVVHPAFRRRGIGSGLVRASLELARAEHADRLDAWAYNGMSGTRELARRFAFTQQRLLLEIRLADLPSAPVPALPAGLEPRAFRPGEDDAAWLALNNLAFAWHPEQGHWDAQDVALRLREPWFRAGDFLLVTRGTELVAFNWLKLDETNANGEVYVIGVHPSLQGQRVGQILTSLGFQHMRARGMTHASAYVDATNSAALRMYYRLGFVIHHADVCWARTVVEASPA
ncbi:MAG TPA: mycothiol synthase [Chloroflexota bacterium]|nr:mycothiol synthase [Chloroflexota bacterium]